MRNAARSVKRFDSQFMQRRGSVSTLALSALYGRVANGGNSQRETTMHISYGVQVTLIVTQLDDWGEEIARRTKSVSSKTFIPAANLEDARVIESALQFANIGQLQRIVYGNTSYRRKIDVVVKFCDNDKVVTLTHETVDAMYTALTEPAKVTAPSKFNYKPVTTDVVYDEVDPIED